MNEFSFAFSNESRLPPGFAVEQWAERHKLYAGPIKQNSCLHELIDPNLNEIQSHDDFTESGLVDFQAKVEKAAAVSGPWQDILINLAGELKLADQIDDDGQREIVLFNALHYSDDVVRRAVEEQEVAVLSSPDIALDFIKEELAERPIHPPGVSVSEVEDLVRAVEPESVDEAADTYQTARLVLIARLVHELRSSWTAKGILMWFDRPRYQIGESTPRQMIDTDVYAAAERLMALARGGRSQIST